jgi:hypothetical protein
MKNFQFMLQIILFINIAKVQLWGVPAHDQRDFEFAKKMDIPNKDCD